MQVSLTQFLAENETVRVLGTSDGHCVGEMR